MLPPHRSISNFAGSTAEKGRSNEWIHAEVGAPFYPNVSEGREWFSCQKLALVDVGLPKLFFFFMC